MFLTFFLLLFFLLFLLLFLLSFSFCLASSPIRVNGTIFTFYSAVNSIFPIGTFNYFSLKKIETFPIKLFFQLLKKKKEDRFYFSLQNYLRFELSDRKCKNHDFHFVQCKTKTYYKIT